jgi:RNA polymerase sigma-54 factor
MVLKDIAEKIGVDISTVSRVTGRRYVQTPFGTLLLKNLFSEAANAEDGISSNAIKQALTELVNNEDKNKPYTDEKLSKLLENRGYNISRRTVAKYREQLGISATSIRKQ